MTDLKELRDLHNARSRFYDPLTASSFEVACIEALPALLDVAEAAEALCDKSHEPENSGARQYWDDWYVDTRLCDRLEAALARLTEGKP